MVINLRLAQQGILTHRKCILLSCKKKEWIKRVSKIALSTVKLMLGHPLFDSSCLPARTQAEAFSQFY